MRGEDALLVGLLCLLPFLAYGPMVTYALFVWWFDRFEKEPLRLIWWAFLWGSLLAGTFAGYLNSIALAVLKPIFGPSAGYAITAVAVAPIVEELLKGLFVLLLFSIHRREIDSLYDGFLYGSLVGFGFAAAENLDYFEDALSESGLAGLSRRFFWRALVFGTSHAAYTALTGLGVAAARLSRSTLVRVAAPVLALSGAIALHSVFNLMSTVGASNRITNSSLLCLLMVAYCTV